jgi:hypothetical protein
MPLRLTTSDKTASGHHYDDVLGVRYEYPSRYRGVVQEGERFVCYRGERRAGGGRGQPAYLGVGIIGAIWPSAVNPAYFVCDIQDWELFAEPLYFKDAFGNHYEPGATGNKAYWQPGVRRIPEDVFARILREATAVAAAVPRVSDAREPAELADAYASAALRDSDRPLRRQGRRGGARSLWPESDVVVESHNNPGFDILVGSEDNPARTPRAHT